MDSKKGQGKVFIWFKFIYIVSYITENEKRSPIDVSTRRREQQIDGHKQSDGQQQPHGRSQWQIGTRQQIGAQSGRSWSGQNSQN